MSENRILNSKGRLFHYYTDDIKAIIQMIEDHPKISTAVFLIILSAIRYFFWVLTYGKADYWGIGVEWINSDTNNVVYERLQLLFYGIILLAMNGIPCLIAKKTRNHKWLGVIFIVLSLLFIWIVFLLTVSIIAKTSLISVINYSSKREVGALALISFVVTLGSVSCGIFISFSILFNNGDRKPIAKTMSYKNGKNIAIILSLVIVVFLSIESFLFKMLGEDISKMQRVFTIVENYVETDEIITGIQTEEPRDNTYVVLGEKDGYYICSPVHIDEKKKSITIDVNRHLTISAKNVLLKTISYSSVDTIDER